MFNRKNLELFLRMLAPIFGGVALLHLTLGMGADALLGAQISAETMSDPGLDSQNRFYGVTFALYGAIFWLGSADIERYGPALAMAMLFFFLAGLARLVSVALLGWPPTLIGLLLASELLLPPTMWFWLRSVRRATAV